ncbi:MAG: paraquat-inducible protein A [Syntrophales bacterium]
MPDIIACPHCDLLQRVPALPPSGKARCPRCGHAVATSKPDSLDHTLAFAVAAAIILIITNATPIMGLMAGGRETSTTILGAAMAMWLRGQEITALLVVFCTVVAPAIHIGFMITLLLAARRSPVPWWVGKLLRWSEWHKGWGMVEVMMLGILVALVKIAELARVSPGIGMFTAGGLVFLIAAMIVSFDPREVWERVQWANGETPAAHRESAVPKGMNP